ncbi:MAG TPA: gephyrin-like molybdotransferase Glp [bacterium]
MISVQKAIDSVLSQTPLAGPEPISILDAAGYILAEDVHSDIAMPPFDKSTMDGYALRFSDAEAAPVVLEVVGVVPAGATPKMEIRPGQAVKIMTGAPLPIGSDAVQMVEKTQALAERKVKILEPVARGQNISPKSEIIKIGEKLVASGTYITPAVIGLLSAVGKKQVQIHRRPRVAILVTGDELVDIDKKPLPGQIRNSNGYALYHQVRSCGAIPEVLGIAPDDLSELRSKIAIGLECDVLLISGGVSMGDLDFVEKVFADLGVSVFFDAVNIKPGKPTVFGKKGSALVFGLPGNPVSASTIFEVMVRPLLRKLMGFIQVHNTRMTAIAANDFSSKTRRENFAPAWSYLEGNTVYSRVLQSKGSADIVAFAESNSFAVIPGEVQQVGRGEPIEIMLRDEFWNTCRLAQT